MDEQIAETPITWTIIEADLSRKIGTAVKTGAHRFAKLLTDVNGYVSFIVLLQFDWESPIEGLPEKAIAKITSCAKLAKMNEQSDAFEIGNLRENCASFSNNELHFYEKAFTEYDFPQELKIPAFYGGREFGVDGVEASYILLEYFEGTESQHYWHSIDKAAIFDVLRQLAILGGHSLKYPEKFANVSNDCYEKLFYNLTTAKQLRNAINEVSVKFPELKADLQVLHGQTKYFESWQKFVEFSDKICKRRMFVHADAWIGNMIWRRETDGSLQLLALIDFQNYHHLNAATDLSRFFVSAIHPDDYHKEINGYLRFYFDELQKHAPLPWDSFEQFVECYEKRHVLSAVFLATATLSVADFFVQSEKNDKAKAAADLYAKMSLFVKEGARLALKWNL